MSVKASSLDGTPFTPSQREDGALLVPLRRSAGDNRPGPFEIELLLASAAGPSASSASAARPEARPDLQLGDHLPRAGTALRDERSDLAADRPLDVQIWFARGWLLLPLHLAAIAARLRAGARGPRRARRALAIRPALLFYDLGHRGLFLALPTAALSARWSLGPAGLRAALAAQLALAPGSWRAVGAGGKVLRVILRFPLAIALLSAILALLRVLARPLGG